MNNLRFLGTPRSSAIVLTSLLWGSWMLQPTPVSPAGIPGSLTGSRKPQATAPARVEQRRKQTDQITPEYYDLTRYPIVDAQEEHWRNLLWTTAVVGPQEPFVAEALEQILALLVRSGLSESQERTIDAATKVGTQLYRRNPQLYAKVGQRFQDAIDQSSEPEWVAVSLAGLAADLPADRRQALAQRVKQRFPNWATQLALRTTLQEVETTQPLPPIADLLTWTIAPNQLHLYVLCQHDRSVLCRAVLKDRQGQFVRQGQVLWTVPLLLRSLHNLNWNFVRGNTPQGIFRIEGTVPQPDDEFFRAYGQFSLVNLYLPFESGAREFLPAKLGAFHGELADYEALLPNSWRGYFPIQQSFWAGRIGRSEFRIHGTGESPDFFSGKNPNSAAYRWNPTIGCLSALELYNDQGQLIEADMLKILGGLRQAGGDRFTGYLIVVEVGNGEQPIALQAIAAAIEAPQAKTAAKPVPPLPAPDPIVLPRPGRLSDAPSRKPLVAPAPEPSQPFPLAY